MTGIFSIEPYSKGRLQGVDLLRFYAAFAVVTLHTHAFRGAFDAAASGDTEYRVLGIMEMVLRQGASFAVPFFFILSGYFLCNHVMSGRRPVASLLSHSKRLIAVWFFWSFAYFFLPTGDIYHFEPKYLDFLHDKVHHFATHPLEILKNGGVGHFYFFPNLLVGLWSITFLYVLRLRNVLILPFLLYCLFVASTIHAPAPAGIYGRIVNSYAVQMFSGSILFVSIGWWLRSTDRTVGSRPAILIALAGFLLTVGSSLLREPSVARIGMIPYATGLAMLAVSPIFTDRKPFLSRLGRYSLGIFASHLFFIAFLMPVKELVEDHFAVEYSFALEFGFPILLCSLSLLLSILFSKNKWLRPMVV